MYLFYFSYYNWYHLHIHFQCNLGAFKELFSFLVELVLGFLSLNYSDTFLFAALLPTPPPLMQACRERVVALQTKISARNERIKLLTQRGTPDLEPLDS